MKTEYILYWIKSLIRISYINHVNAKNNQQTQIEIHENLLPNIYIFVYLNFNDFETMGATTFINGFMYVYHLESYIVILDYIRYHKYKI